MAREMATNSLSGVPGAVADFYAFSRAISMPREIVASTTVDGSRYELVLITRAYGTQCVLVHADVRSWMRAHPHHPVIAADWALTDAISSGGFRAAAVVIAGTSRMAPLIGHDTTGKGAGLAGIMLRTTFPRGGLQTPPDTSGPQPGRWAKL